MEARFQGMFQNSFLGRFLGSGKSLLSSTLTFMLKQLQYSQHSTVWGTTNFIQKGFGRSAHCTVRIDYTGVSSSLTLRVRMYAYMES